LGVDSSPRAFYDFDQFATLHPMKNYAQQNNATNNSGNHARRRRRFGTVITKDRTAYGVLPPYWLRLRQNLRYTHRTASYSIGS